MNLKKKLDAYKKSFISKVPESAQEIMRNANEALLASDIMAQVVEVGDKAPPFSLEDTGGRRVSLDTLLTQGPLVLTFYRGTW